MKSNKIDHVFSGELSPDRSKIRLTQQISYTNYLQLVINAEVIELMLSNKMDHNQILYEFSIMNNNKKWKLRKTLAMMQNLHIQITKLSESALQLPQLHLIDSLAADCSSEVSVMVLEYLKGLFRYKDILSLPIVQEFLSISEVEIQGAKKYLELFILKRAGGRHKQTSCWHFYRSCHQTFKQRYLVIVGDGIVVAKGKYGMSARVREMLLFDYNITIEYGREATGYTYGVIIKTQTRNLCVKALNIIDYLNLIVELRCAYQQCQSTQLHRYDSFAPIRYNVHADAFVDAQEYYESVSIELLAAQQEILITDWWLSPQLYMRRPPKSYEDFRLDKLFEKKAIEGVKIYIIVYNEPKVALTINSGYTQRCLSRLHPNIMVLRHPNSVVPILWSHHEKIVVIDQKVGFIGGLDLCYGRMDSMDHQLFDPDCLFPGCDYANNRVSDFKDVENYMKCDVDRNLIPRMPWHDIHFKLVGSVVNDLSRHFIQYWNFVCVDLQKKDQFTVLQLQEDKQSSIIQKYKSKVSDWSRRIGDFAKRKIQPIDNKQTIQIQLSGRPNKKPRSLSVSGNDIRTLGIKRGSENFISKRQADIYRETTDTLSTDKKEDILNTLIKLSNQEDDQIYLFKPTGKSVTESFQSVDQHQFNEQQINFELQRSNYNKGTCTAQILRSASNWSLGLDKQHTESSIQMAYVQLITNAKFHIYIENQFFISSIAGPPVMNQIGQALIQRIVAAHQNQDIFHVMIVLPLLPGFEGEIEDDSSNVMRVQLHYEYSTICRGGTSLLEQLSKEIGDPSQYITFVGLRTHGINSINTPVTEIIYVHSKLMIVDDRFILCGSANINDRSLKGSRDSEIAVVLEDNCEMPVNTQARQLAYDLRRKLYTEHFNMSGYYNPSSIETVQFIQQQLKENTLIYRHVFACYPDDTVSTMEELKEFRKQSNLSEYSKVSHLIKGHAVEWPTRFLIKESLKLPVFAKEQLVPDINFT